jgi:hypothetical protein
MPEATKEQALDLLTREVREKFDQLETLEVYNELFPDDARPFEEAPQDVRPLTERLVEHIRSRTEEAEIADLWSLIIPRHRRVWYNEEEELIHYNEHEDEELPFE